MENYFIRISVRDKNGKLIKDENGNVRIDINFEISESKIHSIESYMRSYKTILQTWMPENQISIEVGYISSISATCPTLYELTNEGKFLKF